MRAWCISDGTLWRIDGDRPPEQVESAFAQEVIARNERQRHTQGWKTAPRENYQGIIPQSMLWGGRGQACANLVPARFRYAVRGKDAGSLYYMIDLNGSSALFHYSIADKRETRIFHHAQFQCRGMAYDAERDALVISCENKDGTANLAVYDKDGNSKGAVTGGDAVDAAPSCSMRENGVVLFQSAGIARHPQSGHAIALGPSAINRLHYATGKLDTVAQDPAYDYLAPREDRKGNVYYIRRPYERSTGEHATSLLKDIFLFPWRIVKALFGWLNFFTTIYGREPLRSSGGPGGNPLERDLASMWLHGRMIELSQVRREDGRGGLVPSSWQLRRISPDGQDTFVADHVVSFDLAEDASVFYSNGFEVFHILQGNPTSRKHDGLIESVSAA
jgi:hypothetical protein